MLLKKAVSTLLLGALCASLTAQADVKIGVITSSTGPIALVGIPQKNSIALMPSEAGGEAIRYVALDDGSDPTATVKAFKKLLDEEKVDALSLIHI